MNLKIEKENNPNLRNDLENMITAACGTMYPDHIFSMDTNILMIDGKKSAIKFTMEKIQDDFVSLSSERFNNILALYFDMLCSFMWNVKDDRGGFENESDYIQNKMNLIGFSNET
jgi:hypothetical protein